MRLVKLIVEQFEPWNALELPLEAGVTVLYGPNEAGKTTLKHFIEQILFGFDKSGSGVTRFVPGRGWTATPQRLAGALELQHQDQRWVVRRVRERDGAERTVVQCDGQAVSEQAFREQVLAGLDRSTFQTVFAFGLDELQSLARAEPSGVAAQLYELTVGPDGQRLLQVLEQAERARERLVGRAHPSGRLAELLEQWQQLEERQKQAAANLARYESLWQKRRQLEETLKDLQQRMAGMERELRGCQLMRRAWEPWSRLQQLRSELAELPAIDDFPQDGLDRLNRLEARLRSLRQRRVELAGQAAEARRQLTSLVRRARLQRLKPQVEWLRVQEAELARERERVERLRQAVSAHQQDLEQQLSQLGATWTRERLCSVQTSVEAGLRLLDAAHDFRRRTRRVNLLRQQYRHRRRRHRDRADRLQKQLQQLGGQSPDEALQQAKQTLIQVHRLAKLRGQVEQLRASERNLSEQLQRLRKELALPRWATLVFALLGAGGAVVGAIGLWQAAFAAGWAGWTVSLAATTCLTTLWALRGHFANSQSRLLNELQDRWFTVQLKLRKAERELGGGLAAAAEVNTTLGGEPRDDECQRQFDQSGPRAAAISEQSGSSTKAVEAASSPSQPADTADQVPVQQGAARGNRSPVNDTQSLPSASEGLRPEEKLLAQLRRRIFRLERLLQRKRRLIASRRRLFKLRERFLREQQELSEARHRWCETARSIGLDETLDVDAAVAVWQQATRAAATLARLEAASAEVRSAEQRLEQQQSLVESQRKTLMEAVKMFASIDETPEDATSENLLRLVQEGASAKQERCQWNRQLRRVRAQLQRVSRLIRRTARQRAALLVHAGASSRQEFERREAVFRRRQELLASIERCQVELNEVGQSESEFAIVEEDLRRFDPEHNDRQIRALTAELESLQADVMQTLERLGRVKQEIDELEAEATGADVRLDECLLKQRWAELADAVWAVELAADCFERLWQQVERRTQPELLERASGLFRQLTGGRYVRVWRPLQERALLVDQENGLTLRAEQLSRATREQLDLALRLALAETLEPAKDPLPLILDDPLVNFDHRRAERAGRELMQVGRIRQILYLTCHLHLARLLETCGASVKFLPEPSSRDWVGTTPSEDETLERTTITGIPSLPDRQGGQLPPRASCTGEPQAGTSCEQSPASSDHLERKAG